MPNGDSSVLLIILCAGNISEHENPEVSKNYKNNEINKTIIIEIEI